MNIYRYKMPSGNLIYHLPFGNVEAYHKFNGALYVNVKEDVNFLKNLEVSCSNSFIAFCKK